MACALSLVDANSTTYRTCVRNWAQGWLTARQLYELQFLNLLHKIRRTGESQALASRLLTNSQVRSRSTRQDADLALPRVRTAAGKRRFLYAVVQQYNSLPTVLREASLQSFKRELREILREV